MYCEQVCRAGRTEDHNLYYSIRYNNGEKRERKSKPTSKAQQAINRKRALVTLTRLMNANFSGKDLYVTWTYEKRKRPGSAEKFRENVQVLLRKLRKYFKKQGQTLKYIWVGERGSRGAEHVHMVMTGCDPRVLSDLWEHGYVYYTTMDASGSYRKLAAYFMKYSDTTMKNEERLQGKRYNSSKNLIHPEPEKTRIRKWKRFNPNTIKVPDGWYLDQETVEFGVSEITGYEYLRYTLIMLPGRNIPEKRRSKRKCQNKRKYSARTM